MACVFHRSRVKKKIYDFFRLRNLHAAYFIGKNLSVPTSICTDLVVWGKNLTSGVGWGRHTKQERNMIAIPPYQYSVIVGLLLSEGWLIIPGTTHISPRLGLSL